MNKMLMVVVALDQKSLAGSEKVHHSHPIHPHIHTSTPPKNQ